MRYSGNPWRRTTSGPSPSSSKCNFKLRLVAIHGRVDESRAEGQRGDAGGNLAGVLFCVRRGLAAAVFQIVAGGVQILVDVDVLKLALEVVHHVAGDAETAEEALQTAAA